MAIVLTLKKDTGRVLFTFAPDKMLLQVENFEKPSISRVHLTKREVRTFLANLNYRRSVFMPDVYDKKEEVVTVLRNIYATMEQHSIFPELKNRIKDFLKTGI